MNKVICDVCGTSYPDTATQCPICGCEGTNINASVTSVSDGQNNTRTYVKGGKYSKANVRKVHAGGTVAVGVASKKKVKKTERPDNFGLKIAVMALLLAIICVAIYIAIVMSRDKTEVEQVTTVAADYQGKDDVQDNQGVADDKQDRVNDNKPVEISVSFSKECVELTDENPTETIVINTNAGDISDCKVVAKDTEIATAELSGNAVVVTAVAGGDTIVELYYNDQLVDSLSVSCKFKLILEIETNIKLESIGEVKYILKSKFPDEEAAKIKWKSSDSTIATVDGGKVVAFKEGTVTITAEYNDQVLTCEVNCAFKGDGTSTGNDQLDQSVIGGTGGGITPDG